jgi:hypothetical protein
MEIKKRKQSELQFSPPHTQQKDRPETVHWNKSELQQINSETLTDTQPYVKPLHLLQSLPQLLYQLIHLTDKELSFR